jgi:uncharacterized protein (DUF488 family)
MYYRRKILLALLQQFGGALSRTDLQKLLFLYCQKQSEPSFHFLPYKYGCFSYQANQDLSTMMKYSQVEESNNQWKIVDKTNYINHLNMKDRIGLVQFYNNFKDIKGDNLIKYVYENYPYYAINSEIAGKILDEKHYRQVLEQKPQKDDITLFTIGYEGKSVEEYVNQLIDEDIKVLLSMKYGFSKNQLKNIVENIGIQYIHIPELGIESSKRQELNNIEDYRALFADYEMNTLPRKLLEIERISDILKSSHRIALTCFEADPDCCHRSIVAKALSERLNRKYPVKHI